MLSAILTRARDSRFVWDLFGPIYNRHIHGAISELYGHIAQGLCLDGPAQVLDVGTGPGYVALHVAQRYPSADVVGIDFSRTQVRAAERLRNEMNRGNCRFIEADAMRLPFDPESFDAVVSVGSIKHWPDAGRGLREILRVLRPGGVAVVSETDREVSEEDFERFMSRFRIWYIWGPLLAWGTRRIVFGQSYSQGQIAGFMEDTGFVDIRTERLDGCPYVIVRALRP